MASVFFRRRRRESFDFVYDYSVSSHARRGYWITIFLKTILRLSLPRSILDFRSHLHFSKIKSWIMARCYLFCLVITAHEHARTEHSKQSLTFKHLFDPISVSHTKLFLVCCTAQIEAWLMSFGIPAIKQRPLNDYRPLMLAFVPPLITVQAPDTQGLMRSTKRVIKRGRCYFWNDPHRRSKDAKRWSRCKEAENCRRSSDELSAHFSHALGNKISRQVAKSG